MWLLVGPIQARPCRTISSLFDAGAHVTAYVVDFLTGDHLQPSLVRQFLDHGLNPNSKLSNNEPLLKYVSVMQL